MRQEVGEPLDEIVDERLPRTEAEIERLKTALDAARARARTVRPWWQRLLGRADPGA